MRAERENINIGSVRAIPPGTTAVASNFSRRVHVELDQSHATPTNHPMPARNPPARTSHGTQRSREILTRARIPRGSYEPLVHRIRRHVRPQGFEIAATWSQITDGGFSSLRVGRIDGSQEKRGGLKGTMTGETNSPQPETGTVIISRLTSPTPHDIQRLATVFDAYRAHYGVDTSTSRAAQWLDAEISRGRLEAFIASDDENLIGFALTTVIPASLSLGHFWQIRDLFVTPSLRRRGLGGLLLDAICESAAASGALRVSLQTESDNTTALGLYAQRGFTVIEGYRSLTLPLAKDS